MKRNLLKVIGISFLIFVILSWIIPVGTYSSGKLSTDGTDPIGLYDLFSTPVSTILTFALYAVVFAAIGGLYGVIDKTGALKPMLEKASKNKGKGFLIFSIIFFVVLSSLTGLSMLLFVLVPLFASIIFAKGYDKITALASTVGGILAGSVCSTYGFNITGYTKNLLSVDMSNEVVAKLILLVLLTAALIFFVIKKADKLAKTNALINEDSNEAFDIEEEEIKEETKKTSKKTTVAKKVESKKADTKNADAKKTSAKKTTTTKNKTKKTTTKKGNTKNFAITKNVKKVKAEKTVSSIPFMVITIIMLLIAAVGMYNWYYAFGVEFFNDIHETVMGIKIGDYPIVENIFSSITQLGYWGNTELVVIIIIISAFLAFVYRLSLNEYVESFIKGVKEMMPTAIYAALASVILYVLYTASYSGSGTITNTIFAKILGDDFNVVLTAISTLIGSFFYNDLYYLLSGLSAFVSSYSAGDLKVAALLIQSVYGIGMMIFPTSIVLIAGLSYFDVKWTEWIKYIWKLLLGLFILVIATCLILTVL